MNTATAAIDPTVYVDPFPGRKGSDRIVETCGACGGDGIYKAPSPHGTRCFPCDGTGEYSFLVSSRRATARRHAKEAQQRAADRAAAAAWPAANPEMDAALNRLAGFAPDFAESLRAGITRRGELTDKQAAAVLSALAKHDERVALDATAEPVAEGRVVITGEILSVKETDDPYSFSGGTITKLVVRDDRGFKLYGTCPRGLQVTVDEDGYNEYHEVKRGMRVTFTATVEASKDDAGFGFWKRPVKASVVAGE
jgi:hypothetical protein